MEDAARLCYNNIQQLLEEKQMAGRKRIFNDRPLRIIIAVLIAVMLILFIRYMASSSGWNRSPENREAVQSTSASAAAGTEGATASSEASQGILQAVAADSSESSSETGKAEESGETVRTLSASSPDSLLSGADSAGDASGKSAESSSVSSDSGTDDSAVKGDTAVLSDGNGNTVTVTYDSGVAWYDENQNVYSPLGSGNWMDQSGNIYTEEDSSNTSGSTAGGGNGINLVQNRG